jgi:hypothetical protein
MLSGTHPFRAHPNGRTARIATRRRGTKEPSSLAEQLPFMQLIRIRKMPRRVRDRLCGLAGEAVRQPIVVPAIILAEPQGSEGEDGLDTVGVPERLGPFNPLVELFHRRLNQARSNRSAFSPGLRVVHVLPMTGKVNQGLRDHPPRMLRRIGFPNRPETARLFGHPAGLRLEMRGPGVCDMKNIIVRSPDGSDKVPMEILPQKR